MLRGVDLAIREAERVALVGESGCGKSMTALSLLNLLPKPPMEMTVGRIWYKGRSLENLPESGWKAIRGKEIGMIFQEPFNSLNPVIPVGLQIGEILQAHSELSKQDIQKKTASLLTDVGLSDPARIMEQYPHQLSGGMCQRVMIGMAIACGPSLLIADEPTTALDVTVQMQILDLMFQMTAQYRLAVLFITHNLRIVKRHADLVMILYLGLIVEEGSPEQIFENPLHPYTAGLIASLPDYSHKGKTMFTIGGVVPSPFEAFSGCAFAGRCPHADKKCLQEPPEFTEISKGHKVRCFYPLKK